MSHISQDTATTSSRKVKLEFILWMLLLAVVFAGFILLGNWQVRRYHLKVGIARDIATRVHAPPVAAPGPAAWPRILAGHDQYLHVRLRGRFIGNAQTLVHGASEDGYGYWVMAPLKTERDFIVLVNRGYIPPGLPRKPAFQQIDPPTGSVTLTGLLRFSEPGGSFLRHNDPANHRWYSRDVAAIAAARSLPAGQVAPYFVDAGASNGGNQWPAGGLTNIRVYNHSFGYAVTWYLLALGTLIAAGVVVHHERWASPD